MLEIGELRLHREIPSHFRGKKAADAIPGAVGPQMKAASPLPSSARTSGRKNGQRSSIWRQTRAHGLRRPRAPPSSWSARIRLTCKSIALVGSGVCRGDSRGAECSSSFYWIRESTERDGRQRRTAVSSSCSTDSVGLRLEVRSGCHGERRRRRCSRRGREANGR